MLKTEKKQSYPSNLNPLVPGAGYSASVLSVSTSQRVATCKSHGRALLGCGECTAIKRRTFCLTPGTKTGHVHTVADSSKCSSLTGVAVSNLSYRFHRFDTAFPRLRPTALKYLPLRTHLTWTLGHLEGHSP